jgi:hypothetical protein
MALLILPDKDDPNGEWQVEFRAIWEIDIDAEGLIGTKAKRDP